MFLNMKKVNKIPSTTKSMSLFDKDAKENGALV